MYQRNVRPVEVFRNHRHEWKDCDVLERDYTMKRSYLNWKNDKNEMNKISEKLTPKSC